MATGVEVEVMYAKEGRKQEGHEERRDSLVTQAVTVQQVTSYLQSG
jgi:hypothetical protein